jgi:hypothetical protein
LNPLNRLRECSRYRISHGKQNSQDCQARCEKQKIPESKGKAPAQRKDEVGYAETKGQMAIREGRNG